MPLFNAAGVLEVTPGAGYPGFTEPDRPRRARALAALGGRRTLARLVGDDIAQARALLRRRAGDRQGAPRIAVEQEPGPWPTRSWPRCATPARGSSRTPPRADAVIYAGEDPDNAAGRRGRRSRARRPRTPVVLPDALTRAGIAGRLSPAARRRAVLVSSAPEPGSTPALRDFEAGFREHYGREPGPYAAVGYEAMRRVLAAIAARATAPATRQAVHRRLLRRRRRRGTLLGDYALAARADRARAVHGLPGARRPRRVRSG